MNKRGFKHTQHKAVSQELKDMKRLPASHWEKEGERLALRVHRFASTHVPAYQSFIQKDKNSVRTIADFKKLPITSKAEYLRPAEYSTLFPEHGITTATTISATSGSTGVPFFFPRDDQHDAYYERALERLLLNQWDIKDKRTLCIIGFGLGIWIGGIFTYKNLNTLARRDYPLTLVPVGPNKDLYLETFKKFASHFDQIILMGYPPFVKEALDAGAEHGIDWSAHHIRILTAAEGFSEAFRNHLIKTAGIQNAVNDIVNIYGTVEQGTIAHETAFSNLIRRVASDDKHLFKTLFPHSRNMPTLAQYDPRMVYFEEHEGMIVATSYSSSIPLVRYGFSDLGGVIPFADMIKRIESSGIDIMNEAHKHGISDKILKLPFVFVSSRADFVIVHRGANIYPEEIKDALDSHTLSKYITGRFTAIRRENRALNQTLDVHVELKKHTTESADIRAKVTQRIIEGLCNRNTEYRNNYTNDPKASTPHVILHTFGDPKYFDRKGKQRWVERS